MWKTAFKNYWKLMIRSRVILGAKGSLFFDYKVYDTSDSMSMAPNLGTTLGSAFVKNRLTYIHLHLNQKCIKVNDITIMYKMFVDIYLTFSGFFNMMLIRNTIKTWDYRNHTFSSVYTELFKVLHQVQANLVVINYAISLFHFESIIWKF